MTHVDDKSPQVASSPLRIRNNVIPPYPSRWYRSTALNKGKISALKPAGGESIHGQHKFSSGTNPTSSSRAHAYQPCSTAAKIDVPRRVVVRQFHGSNLLSTRHIEDKADILTQHGLTKSESSLYSSNFLVHITTGQIPQSCITTVSKDTCATVDESDTESDEEQYVGHPFYMSGENDEPLPSKVGRGIVINRPPATKPTAVEPSIDFTSECVLSPSLFPNVAPYLNFASHAERGPTMPVELRKVLKWKLSAALPKIVRRIVLNTGFRLIKNATDWMAVWENYMRSPNFRMLQSHQKFNHLPGSCCIARKDTMWRSIHSKIKKFGAKEYGFMQRSYILPDDMEKLRLAWPKHANRQTKWIVKPPASSRGNGIRVVSTWGQFCKDRPMVVQKYIERPLLINNSKFDMRLYVVVTSIDPLRIYMHKDGLARFASKDYSTEADSLDDRCRHLTNYSINKLSESYLKNDDFKCCHGHKWTLQALWSCLQERGVDTKRLWATLRDLVIKSMICGENEMKRMYRQNVNFRNNCYELFGFDVLLDENMVPWLMEVNISPSLHSELPIDWHVKGPLIQAMLNTALYQVPPKLDEQQQSHIIRKFELPCTSLCMDKRLFANCLTPNELLKHDMYTDSSVESRQQYLDGILQELLPDDVRCLLISEDELHRCAPLERVFPTAETHIYMRFVEEKPGYYNRLMDAWENRYSNQRAAGVALLSKLCKDGVHLQVSQEAMDREPNCTLNDIKRSASKATFDSRAIMRSTCHVKKSTSAVPKSVIF